MKVLLLLVPLFIFLVGCSEDKGIHDLDLFMQQARSQPVGEIEPIPTHEAFEVASYGASALRSPFEPPKIALEKKQFDRSIRPDRNRVKHHLEQFPIASFSMVGYVSIDKSHWGLVRNNNRVFRVKEGDYLGRNHGRITSINEEEIQLVEIMPVGAELWVERLRRIPLSHSDKK
ncbi:MAG: pilus assembly protein PilP [Endozoicomonas sp. (ex Botrylloides leachii)]|nr:pilus assembly protein PilP [Endozoicomonas sp. (ex Botrylloides leachii)]